MSEAADPVGTYRMSILDHLRELRTRLVIAMWASLVCVVVAFFFSEQLYDWISAPMVAALKERGEGTMAITDPLEGVFTYLQVSVIAGLFAASPVVFSQIWLFVAPGLYASERKVVLPLVISSTFLFLSGGAFCYYVMFGYGFKFLLDVVSMETAAVLSMSADWERECVGGSFFLDQAGGGTAYEQAFFELMDVIDAKYRTLPAAQLDAR